MCVGAHVCMWFGCVGVYGCMCVWAVVYGCGWVCMWFGWVGVYVCMGAYVMWATNHAPALLPINRHVSSFTVPELVRVRVNVRVRVRANV